MLEHSHMLGSSAAALEKIPGWPRGRVSSQAVVSSFSDLLRSNRVRWTHGLLSDVYQASVCVQRSISAGLVF